MKKIQFPWGHKVLPKPAERRTPLIYTGGKTSVSDWVIGNFPPHRIFVDVFGGGGGIIFSKQPSVMDIYNDIGNVSRFMRVLQIYGDELFTKLYFTQYSREQFQWATNNWRELKRIAQQTKEKEDILNWAAAWYIQISQSYTHSEFDTSWIFSNGVDMAKPVRNHVDELPYICDRLRSITIESLPFERLIEVRDGEDVLFYCDPPYISSSRSQDKKSQALYEHEMDRGDHELLLQMLNNIKGQCVLSGYEDELYYRYTEGWRVCKRTRRGQMHNSTALKNGGVSTRTEVLFIKEHQHGLWTSVESQAHVSRISVQEANTEEFDYA